MMILNSPILHQLPILLFISFDGFRKDYLSPNLTPNLYELSKQASLGSMRSMYVTKTFPNHFSMVTGLYEDEHEIVNNHMFDPRLNSTFSPSNVNDHWWNPKGNTVPIWIANQNFSQNNTRQRQSALMMYPGSPVPFSNTLPKYLKTFDTVRNWTLNMDTVIDWITHPEEPANFACMYFDDPDNKAHTYGPWGQETLKSIAQLDSAAGYLVKRLRDLDLAHNTNIIFVSDHGLAEIKGHVFWQDFFHDIDSVRIIGTSPVFNIFVKDEKRYQKNKIYNQLLEASTKNHFKIYKRTEIPKHLHYSETPRIGDFMLMVDKPYELFDERHVDRHNITGYLGNHGWDQNDYDMRPFFMAMGPSFRKNYNHTESFPNIDIFPLLVHLLGLPASHYTSEGNISHIIDMIEPESFSQANNIKNVTYFILVGSFMTLLLSALLIMAVSSSKNKQRSKSSVEFDDLVPGLNIDLAFYVDDDKLEDRRKKKKELSALLGNCRR